MKLSVSPKIENLSIIKPNRSLDKFFCKLSSNVKIFCVGGAVRDILLDKPVSDKDFLLVGTDSKTLLDMGLLPIGKDFPVFLHPVSKEEIALARTERKHGTGYKGFQFNSSKDVSLKEDLQRRDFTINALALDEHGKLFDFFSGLKDLQSKIFRHIGPEFTEDPLRLIRLARFLAVYPEFSVHESTLQLCKKIVNAGEIKAISKERIWIEFSKGLSGKAPVEMINFLEKTNAWKTITGSTKLSDGLKNKLIYASKNELSIFWKAAIIFAHCNVLQTHCIIPNKVITYKKIILKSDSFKNTLIDIKKNTKGLSLAILDFMEFSDLFRKPNRKEPILKIMFFKKNDKLEHNLKNYFELFSVIFASVIHASVSNVVKKAQENDKSIKDEIRLFRIKIIKKIIDNKKNI